MKRKRDYQQKDFRNPYFNKRKKTKATSKFKLYILFFLALLIISLFFLNSSQKFRITDIKIEGNKYVSNDEIKKVISDQLVKKRWLIFNQNSIFFFNKRLVKEELIKRFYFDSLEIKKRYFRTIEVIVKEKKTGLILVSGENKYYVDLSGTVVRKADINDFVVQEEGETNLIRSEIGSGQYPVVYDLSNNPVVIGQMVITQKLVDFILEMTEYLESQSDFDILGYNLTSLQADEITLLTKEGWEAHFKVEGLAKDKANLLITILQQKVKKRSDLEYIDLRFGEKIFLK